MVLEEEEAMAVAAVVVAVVEVAVVVLAVVGHRSPGWS